MKKLILISLLLIGNVCQSFASEVKEPFKNHVKIAGKDQPVTIVCSNSPQIEKLGKYLQNFLTERNIKEKQVCFNQLKNNKEWQWILADENDVSRWNLKDQVSPFESSCSNESFQIIVSKEKSRVYIVGKTESGVKAGVARLICKVANDGKNLWIENGKIRCNPFIKLRLMDVGNSARRQVPVGSPFKDADYETWPLMKIRQYPELFWQFGYNGIEVEEVRGYSAISDEKMPSIRKAVQTLATGAKDYGMYVSLFQWGDCLFDEGETLSWNNPKQKNTMCLVMKDLAENYGNLVDHLIIHVGDPGGCERDGCDHYKTPQEITNGFYKAFKKINPKIACTLSTWANGGFWSSCPRLVDRSNYDPYFPNMANDKTYNLPISNGAKFLDTTFMPGNIGIAMNRLYNKDQAELVLASKRPLDVWTWYVGDNEMLNTIWLNMHEMDRLLSNMPKSASNEIRLYTMEISFHGWPEIINSYVGAQKLWNPNSSLDKIEKEFCTGVFGPSNAETMVELYNACENGCFKSLPCPSDFGTFAYNKRLRDILSKSLKIKLAKDWKPNFSLPVSPQKYVDMLVARLKLILCVSEAKYSIVQAKQNGASSKVIEQIKSKAIKNIPYLPIDPLYKQDSSIATKGYITKSFAQIIEEL